MEDHAREKLLKNVVFACLLTEFKQLPEDQQADITVLSKNTQALTVLVPTLTSRDKLTAEKVLSLVDQQHTLRSVLGLSTTTSSTPRGLPQACTVPVEKQESTNVSYKPGNIVLVATDDDGFEYAEVLDSKNGKLMVAWIEPLADLEKCYLRDVTTGKRVRRSDYKHMLTSGVQDKPLDQECVLRLATDKETSTVNVCQRYVYDFGVIPSSPGSLSVQRLRLYRDEMLGRLPPELHDLLLCNKTEGYWARCCRVFSRLRTPAGPSNPLVVELMPEFLYSPRQVKLGKCVWCQKTKVLNFTHTELGGMSNCCSKKYLAYRKLHLAVQEVRLKNILATEGDRSAFCRVLEDVEDTVCELEGKPRKRPRFVGICIDSGSEDECVGRSVAS